MKTKTQKRIKRNLVIPDEIITRKIYFIRDQKVMLDRDLAALYGVPTKRLKEQVKRNIGRFPSDFMFELTPNELENWRSQFATSNREKMGMRFRPFVFTEHGILMLSSILKTKRAISVNIRIMRIHVRLREMLMTNKDLLLKVQGLEQHVGSHDGKIRVLYDYLQRLVEKESKPKRKIGFQVDNVKGK